MLIDVTSCSGVSKFIYFDGHYHTSNCAFGYFVYSLGNVCIKHTTLCLLHVEFMCNNTPLFSTADCIDGDVRLVEGKFEWEGRVEVCLSQRWGTVSSDGWTDINSQVVCDALGYDFIGMFYTIFKSI